jgi:hypothetical protein
MSIIVSFEEPSLFIFRSNGPVTADTCRAAVGSVLADSRLRAGAALLIDNRGVTNTLTTGEFAVIANDFKRVIARGATRLALLSDSDEVHAASKTFASFASSVGAEARGFRDELQARAWVSGAAKS